MAPTTSTGPEEAGDGGRRAGRGPAQRRRLGRAPTVLTVLTVIAASAALWAGCTSSGSSAAPPVPTVAGGGTDPVLATGREVWTDRCARCHGGAGGGGAGPKLDDGRLLRDFPDPAAQVELVREGRKGMPSFEGKISDAEIDAVVRYTREVITAP
jgi:mono/diheme cytochrome c family protein